MKVNMLTIRNMERVSILGLMEENMQEIGKMVKGMEEGDIY